MKRKSNRTEDLRLIRGLQQGNTIAMNEIYRTYFSSVSGFIRKNGGNQEDAKDMFQEAIMVMYRMTQKPDFQLTGSFFSLLFPICRNLWYKTVRKRPYYVEINGEEVQDQVVEKDLEEIITEREVEHLFREKFVLLGDTCQQLLDLFFDGFSMKEIVTKMQISSVSFAKKKKFQCKEKLVALVKSDLKFQELRV